MDCIVVEPDATGGNVGCGNADVGVADTVVTVVGYPAVVNAWENAAALLVIICAKMVGLVFSTVTVYAMFTPANNNFLRLVAVTLVMTT